MHDLNTINELFRHHDWAASKVMTLAATVDDSALDRPFELGPGSLRKTMWHNAICHWLWMTRIEGTSPRSIPASDGPQTLAALAEYQRAGVAQRRRVLDALDDSSLWRTVPFTNVAGESFQRRTGDILIHVANHAQHHHAQASNMLRQLGAQLPRLDYIFMMHETKPSEAPRLSISILKDYFAYNDWGREMILDLAQGLDDASLDRRFEMGCGSIRRNIQHTLDAENFWLGNWTDGPGGTFLQSDERTPVARLREESAATAWRRNDYLAKCSEDDLSRPIHAKPSPERTITFPLGVTMLQLCNHGTHHRAQTINMLRQCGKPAPASDYTLWRKDVEAPA